jgi:hypothetical protein
MASEIDLIALKQAVNQILDHIVHDLGIKTLPIPAESDYYWEVPSDTLHSVKSSQPQLDIGRLSDDWEFLLKMLETPNGAVALMLIHLAPILRYLGEQVGE